MRFTTAEANQQPGICRLAEPVVCKATVLHTTQYPNPLPFPSSPMINNAIDPHPEPRPHPQPNLRLPLPPHRLHRRHQPHRPNRLHNSLPAPQTPSPSPSPNPPPAPARARPTKRSSGPKRWTSTCGRSGSCGRAWGFVDWVARVRTGR